MDRTERQCLICIILYFVMLLVGCGDYQIVNTKEKKILSLVEYEQLRKEADIGRGVGRFSLYTIGYRTWRLDTSTGRSCLLLASDKDWKNPQTATAACRD